MPALPEALTDVPAGCRVGVMIGHDHGGDVAEDRGEHAGGVVAGSVFDREESRVAGLR